MSETAETENVTGESGSVIRPQRIASWLVSKGCGAWKHPKTGEIRIYLNSFGRDLLEIECEYHKTGSLASFSMFGTARSNSYGYKILRALSKCYYSPESGCFVCNGRKDDAEEAGEMLLEAAEEKIRAEGYGGGSEEEHKEMVIKAIIARAEEKKKPIPGIGIVWPGVLAKKVLGF